MLPLVGKHPAVHGGAVSEPGLFHDLCLPSCQRHCFDYVLLLPQCGPKFALSFDLVNLSSSVASKITAHALQGLCEDLRGHAVLMLQDQTLLQGHRHGCAVLGTLAAGESDPIKAATDLSSLPEDVHILILACMDILS